MLRILSHAPALAVAAALLAAGPSLAAGHGGGHGGGHVGGFSAGHVGGAHYGGVHYGGAVGAYHHGPGVATYYHGGVANFNRGAGVYRYNYPYSYARYSAYPYYRNNYPYRYGYGRGFYPGLFGLYSYYPGYYGGYGGYYNNYYPGYFGSLYASLYNYPTTYLPSNGYPTYQPPPSPDAAPDDLTAHILVQVPADAELWFEGVKVTQTGATREFVSPPLQRGQQYTYEIKARWKQDGKEVVQTQRLPVAAGDWKAVDFTRPPAEAAPPPKPGQP